MELHRPLCLRCQPDYRYASASVRRDGASVGYILRRDGVGQLGVATMSTVIRGGNSVQELAHARHTRCVK